MADTTTAVIPYESLDPLTIGASGDDDKVSRDTLELEIPDGEPARGDLPGRARAGRATRRRRPAPRSSRRSPGRASPT